MKPIEEEVSEPEAQVVRGQPKEHRAEQRG